MNVETVIQTMAVLAWILFGGVLVVAVLRASRGKSLRGAVPLVVVMLSVALLLSIVSAGIVFIQPEDRGVVISALSPQGYRSEALTPGLRWVIPFFESVITYPISRQTYTMSIASAEGQLEGDDSIDARTSDGQQVKIDASVIYAIDPAQVVKVHIDWQDRYTDELVRPLSRGVIRDVVSQYGIEQVVTSKRDEMKQNMSDGLATRLAENGLVLEDFILRNITFSPEYAASVEQKQIAEQQAMQAKFVVESKKQEAEQARQTAQGAADAVVIRAKGDAESRLISAEAEAKSLLLIAAALKDNPNLLNYQYINRLAPGIQVMLVPNTNPYILPLPSLSGQTTLLPEPTQVITP
jgi:regulator of protease activity HflC (stomatin/prohibitin superfamily)